MQTKPYKLGQLQFTAPATGSGVTTSLPLDIPPGPLDSDLFIEIIGKPAVTYGNNTPAKTARGDEAAILADVRLQDQAGQQFVRTNGRTIRKEMFFRGHRYPELSPQIGINDGATADPAFSTTYRLMLSLPDGRKNLDMAMFTRMQGRCQLLVDVAGPAAINTDATGWAANGSPVINVYRTPSVGTHIPLMTPVKRYLTGAFSSNQTGEQSIPVKSNSGLPIWGFMLTLINSSGVEDNTLSRSIAIRNGKNYHRNKMSWKSAWESTASMLGLPNLFNRALGAAASVDATGAASGYNQRYSQNSSEDLTATQWLPFPLDGGISGMLSREMDDLNIDLDLTAATNYELLVIEGDPIRDEDLAAVGITRPKSREEVMWEALKSRGIVSEAA